MLYHRFIKCAYFGKSRKEEIINLQIAAYLAIITGLTAILNRF